MTPEGIENLDLSSLELELFLAAIRVFGAELLEEEELPLAA